MGVSAQPGPIAITGQPPAITGPTNPIGGSAAYVDYNVDAGPSLMWGGHGVLDPRYLPNIGGSALSSGKYANQAVGFYEANGIHGMAITPAILATNNIAAGAVTASGTAMTLVAATGAGITVMTASVTVLPTGLVVPSTARMIGSAPAWLGAGQSGAFAFFDPTKAEARAVSITGASGGAGGHFIVAGYDIYGVPMTEDITCGAGVNTANGKKAFKWIASVTPQFTDGTHNYSVGTTDIFGFALKAAGFPNVEIWWNNAAITAATGFVAAVTTSPATTTTGDVRGTYATQDASDGTKVLVVRFAPSVSEMAAATVAAQVAGLFGVTQK